MFTTELPRRSPAFETPERITTRPKEEDVDEIECRERKRTESGETKT
jgi:hypothetical protein